MLRLFDGDFADRVRRTFGVFSSGSVSYLAAPAFAEAMLEREVISSIPVGRHVLLIAEVPVGAGSELDGGPASAANVPGRSRLVALVSAERASDAAGKAGRRRDRTDWSPDGRPLASGDRLIVVTTRAGLSGLLGRAAGGTREAGDGPSPEPSA